MTHSGRQGSPGGKAPRTSQLDRGGRQPGQGRANRLIGVLTDHAVLPGEIHRMGGGWGDEPTTPVVLPDPSGEVVLLARDAYHRRSRPLIGLLAAVDEDVRGKGEVRLAQAYGLRRAAVVGHQRRGAVLMVTVEDVNTEVTAPEDATERLLRLRRQAQSRDSFGGPVDLVPDLSSMTPGELADWIAVHLSPGCEARLALLNAVRWTDRLPILEALYKADRSRRRLPRLRQRRVDTLEDRVKKAPLPPDVRDALERDLAEFGGTQGNGHREAVRIALDLAWDPKPPPAIDVDEARRLLDAGHQGLESAKGAILDRLVVLEWQRRSGQKSLAGPVLCLVGPPGTGKTTLAESAAKAMGRRFEPISLGGVDDVFLAGADRGYNRARPGEIVRRLRASGVHPSEVVWLLDEIDKLADWGGHAALSVLLSLLDPSQNQAWQDHFLDGVRLDLSGSVFLATANERAHIPAPLLDRLRCVDVPAYRPEEQVVIGQTKLLPKLLNRLGAGGVASVDESALYSLVFDHPRSPGCRQLEQRLHVVVARALHLHMQTHVPVVVDAPMARAWVPPERQRTVGFRAIPSRPPPAVPPGEDPDPQVVRRTTREEHGTRSD